MDYGQTYTDITNPDPSQPDISSLDTGNNSTVSSVIDAEPSFSRKHPSEKVRFIVVGVLVFLVMLILLPVLLRRMCRRDRRRRLTIKLIRRHSNSSLHHEETASSSFYAGEKSSEDLFKSTRNNSDRVISCAYSAGLAGIGINKLDNCHHPIPTHIRCNVENEPKLVRL